MNLAASFNAFKHVLREDRDMRKLGRPPGWSVAYHYLGRWHDRRKSPAEPKKVWFSWRGRRLVFKMTEAYLGAFKGVFVDEEYGCAAKLKHAPATILDLGGNIGFGTVFLHHLFPSSEILVVEPDPRNVELLTINLADNQVLAEVLPAAIGPSAGVLSLRFGDNPTCSSLEGTGLHRLQASVDVRVTTVPDVMAKAGWSSIDLLKIDIEGAEDALLSENNQWLADVGALLLEIHPNTTPERIQGFLTPFGFKLERLGAGREPVYFASRA